MLKPYQTSEDDEIITTYSEEIIEAKRVTSNLADSHDSNQPEIYNSSYEELTLKIGESTTFDKTKQVFGKYGLFEIEKSEEELDKEIERM